jgi:hypothetical protein
MVAYALLTKQTTSLISGILSWCRERRALKDEECESTLEETNSCTNSQRPTYTGKIQVDNQGPHHVRLHSIRKNKNDIPS